MKEGKFILLFLFTTTLIYGQHPKSIYPESNRKIVNLKINKKNITFDFQTKITDGWKLILDDETSTDWGVVIGQGKEFLNDDLIKQV